MGYDTEVITDVGKKIIVVNGRDVSVSDFIRISEEVETIINIEMKDYFFML
jgi:hypothetical protein